MEQSQCRVTYFLETAALDVLKISGRTALGKTVPDRCYVKNARRKSKRTRRCFPSCEIFELNETKNDFNNRK